MLSSILILIIGITIVVLVFIMFSIEEPEELLVKNTEDKKTIQENSCDKNLSEANKDISISNNDKNQLACATKPLDSSEKSSPFTYQTQLSNFGDQEDFELRIQTYNALQPLNYIKKENAVVVAINTKISEQALTTENSLTSAYKKLEEVLDLNYIQFSEHLVTKQLLHADRALIFFVNPNLDYDPYFEAVFSAYLLVAKFKKNLETCSELSEAGAKISIGISSGEVIILNRGPFVTENVKGKPVFIAELLALSASDFQIFIDETIYNSAQVWFDLREWIPMKLWHTLPAMKFYEIIGWNKKEEIYSYINHQNASVRKAVATAFKYLEFEELMPLHHLASDNDESVALEAIKTLAEIKDDRSLAVLKKLVTETKNPFIRSEVINALGNLQKSDLMPIFLGYIKDIHWRVRRNSIYAIYNTLGEDSIKHIEQLLSDENGAVRAAALEVFYKVTKNSVYLKELKNLLNDLSVRARKSAILALCSINTNESLAIIVSTFPELDNDLQRFTIAQIQNLNLPQDKKWQYLLSFYKASNEKTRAEIVNLVNNNILTS